MLISMLCEVTDQKHVRREISARNKAYRVVTTDVERCLRKQNTNLSTLTNQTATSRCRNTVGQVKTNIVSDQHVLPIRVSPTSITHRHSLASRSNSRTKLSLAPCRPGPSNQAPLAIKEGDHLPTKGLAAGHMARSPRLPDNPAKPNFSLTNNNLLSSLRHTAKARNEIAKTSSLLPHRFGALPAGPSLRESVCVSNPW